MLPFSMHRLFIFDYMHEMPDRLLYCNFTLLPHLLLCLHKWGYMLSLHHWFLSINNDLHLMSLGVFSLLRCQHMFSL